MQFLHAGETVLLSSRFIDQLPKENEEIKKFIDGGHAHLQSADLSTVGGSLSPFLPYCLIMLELESNEGCQFFILHFCTVAV